MKKYATHFLTAILILLCFSCSKEADISDHGEWIHIADNPHINTIYTLYDGNIYCIDIDPKGTPLEAFEPMYGVDVESFLIEKNSYYAKDKRKVYYPMELRICDGMTMSYMTSHYYVIENADPSTFRYLGDDYAIDRNNMYYQGLVICKNDSIIEKYR